MSTTAKPHLSHSQINEYCMCPEAYRRHRIEKHRVAGGIPAARGKGVHGGAEVNMRQKIESGVDLPTSEIIDAAVAAFDEAIGEGLSLTDEEESTGLSLVTGRARDDVADMALVHAQEQAPEYQPVLVEHEVRIELPNSPRDLIAIIDLADNLDRVTDFKTSSRAKSQADADNSLQLTIYAAAFHAEMGYAPVEVRLDTVVQGKRDIKRSLVTSERGPRDLAALAARIDVVNAAIDAGIFPPAAPGSWNCSARWCGYWKTCRFVVPGRGTAQGD